MKLLKITKHDISTVLFLKIMVNSRHSLVSFLKEEIGKEQTKMIEIDRSEHDYMTKLQICVNNIGIFGLQISLLLEEANLFLKPLKEMNEDIEWEEIEE